MKARVYDGIQMDTANHIWIDHNLITKTNDGGIDSRKDTSYLTVSWNALIDHNKTFGIGWTENVTARMTIHHNWFSNVGQRNPSMDNVALGHRSPGCPRSARPGSGTPAWPGGGSRTPLRRCGRRHCGDR